MTEKLGERELLELKKAFGARAAKKLGTNVQIGNPREVREENERDFCVRAERPKKRSAFWNK